MRRIIERYEIQKQDKETIKRELIRLKEQSNLAYEEFKMLWHDKHKYVSLHETLTWRNKYNNLHDNISIILVSEDFKFLIKLYKDDLKIVPKMYKYIQKFRTRHNRPILSRLRNEKEQEYFTVNNFLLTKEQRTAIVMQEKRVVIQGPGTSGSTLTCIAKAKYLINKMKVPKDEILFLTDSDNHANSINSILNKEVDGIKACTFKDISEKILNGNKQLSPIVEVDYEEFSEEHINKLLEESYYKKRFIDYYVNFRQAGYVVFDFNDVDEYETFLAQYPPITLDGKTVKNYEHLAVADFLYRNNIFYRYMDDYCISTSDYGGGSYKPVFYLPDFDLYIEVFEINTIGEAKFKRATSLISDTTTEFYRERMKRIRNIHETNNTTLIEVFTYEKMNNTLVDHLKQKLLKHDVVFAPMQTEVLIRKIFSQNAFIIRELSVLIADILQLARDYSESWEEIVNLNRGASLTNSIRYKRNESLISLLVPIYEEYIRYLGDNMDSFGVINMASEITRISRKPLKYSHIIVDNFENMNRQRYNLLKNILDNTNEGNLFCVGNDWQSKSGINAYDMTYIADFSMYFGQAETVKFTNVFLQNQQIWSANARFIEKNTSQTKKYARALTTTNNDSFVFLEYEYTKKDNANILFDVKEIEIMQSTIEKYVKSLPSEYSIVLVGRFKEDIKLANMMNIQNVSIKTVYELDRSFDVVIAINSRRYNMGFPERIMGERVRELFGLKPEFYPFAAERRLWHQLISKAKINVAFLYNSNNQSRFTDEFL